LEEITNVARTFYFFCGYIILLMHCRRSLLKSPVKKSRIALLHKN